MHNLRLSYTLAFSTMIGPPSSRPTLRGIVFDMDGTLTVPNLDFGKMYQRCGVSRSEDILDAIASMPAHKAAEAHAIIEEMEEQGRHTLRLAPGAAELGRWIHAHGIPTALVTRNTMKTVNVLVERLWKPVVGDSPTFDPVVSRDEMDDIPHKPHPASLNFIAKSWKISLPTNDLVMVGDSPSNDIVFGKAAGVATALVDTGRRFMDDGTDCGADIYVEGLIDLPLRLWKMYEIDGALGTRAPLLKYPKVKPSSPAAKAAFGGNVDVLRSLPKQDVAISDETGNTPLIWAVEGGRADAVELILDFPGIDVNAKGYLGATAVCRAARRGHVGIIRRLALAGADLNCPNDKMQYPLHFAAFQEMHEVVDALLDLGASTFVLDRKGRTPAEDTKDEKIRNSILAARKKALCLHSQLT